MWVTCFINLKENFFFPFFFVQFCSSYPQPELQTSVLSFLLLHCWHDLSGACNCDSSGGSAGTWAANLGCESMDGHCVVARVCAPASSLQPLLMTAHERQQGPPANPKVKFGPESQTPKSRGLYRWGCLLSSYCQWWSGWWKVLESLWWSHLGIWNASWPSWCIGLITKDHRGPWAPRTPVGTSVLSCHLNPVSSCLIKWSNPGVVALMFYCKLSPCTQCNGPNLFKNLKIGVNPLFPSPYWMCKPRSELQSHCGVLVYHSSTHKGTNWNRGLKSWSSR